jgi:hypothetical protein
MQPSRFDALRERLLRAGIAPRHVRRYVGELRDHLDDLVREETADGASRGAAEIKARTRLGNDEDLAEVMLARPELRSIAARYPWAVFGVSPFALVFAALVLCLVIEFASFKVIHAMVAHPTVAQREFFISAINLWNAFWTTVTPLVIAAAFVVVGLRQRMPPAWTFVGVAVACFFGAFQDIHFSDDGRHGELTFYTAFLPPFPMKVIVGGLYRIVAGFMLAGAIYWLGVHRRHAVTAESDRTASQAAE